MANYERYQSVSRVNRAASTEVVTGSTIPSLKNGETFSMTIAHFSDHGRPCFIGSAIRSNSVFLELARNLTPDESRKANDRLRIEVEKILDGDESRKVATWTAQGKPDIHMLFIGESFDPKSLRLYYTRNVYKNAPAVYQLAIARLKDSSRVERILEEAGYTGGKNLEKRKVH